MTASQTAESYEAGGVAEAGSYLCGSCGLRVGLEALREVPPCPECGGRRFRRAPLFALPTRETETVERDAVTPAAAAVPAWLSEARETLARPDPCLAFVDEERTRVIPLKRGWSRIGRSAAADIRLDDPTVSRRHALIVRTREDEIRVLDDRSLNGISINGEQAEWAPLADGDALEVGRFRLYLLA